MVGVIHTGASHVRLEWEETRWPLSGLDGETDVIRIREEPQHSLGQRVGDDDENAINGR